MSRVDLRRSAEEYLALRRALGFKLRHETWFLPAFVSFLTAHGSSVITTELALRWAQQSLGSSRRWSAMKLGAVRCFARHHRAYDPRTEVPPPDLIPYRPPRVIPHLYTDSEIAALVREASVLRPVLKAATYATILGLLAATGMRVGEALALEERDVDWRGHVLTIRHAKFNKSRLVPLHSTTMAALQRYLLLRDQLLTDRRQPWFFVSRGGSRVLYNNFHATFLRLVGRAGMLCERGRRPRLHDLRHTFALNTVSDWYRSGIDVERRLLSLSTYLGHVHPTTTYRYLTATPHLLALAGERLERYRGRRP